MRPPWLILLFLSCAPGHGLPREIRDAGLEPAPRVLTDIAVLVNTGTRIYVEAPGAPRRIVSLAGLDYPWGVLLVEPGYAEQIITGPVLPDDLRELVYEYFGLEDAGVKSPIAINSNSKLPIADRAG